MVTPEARFKIPTWCMIASLTVTVLSLPISAIAVPAPLTLAYYNPTVNAYELYVRPLWFGRSESETSQANEAVVDESVEVPPEFELDQPLPSLNMPTESERDLDTKT